MVRYADIYMEATRPFTNHPVCAAEERDLLIEAQPPLLEKRRGMNSLQHLSSISKLLGSGNHQKSDVYAHYNHLFRNLWDSSGEFSLQGQIVFGRRVNNRPDGRMILATQHTRCSTIGPLCFRNS